MSDSSQSPVGTEQTADECYWCGGDTADGGSIKVQMWEGEPERETCPDCMCDWPPKEVEEHYVDTDHQGGAE